MAIDPLRASQAYADVARIGAGAPRAEGPAAADKPNFASMVEAAVAHTAHALEAGEAAAARVAGGEASLVDVVTAISAAEASLETAIAVRNKVIEAYQEIMRMPI